MADRSFVRDALGRFAKTAGQAAVKEAKKFAAEEAADAKRVAKAKLAERIAAVKQEVAEANAAVKATDALKEAAHTDSEFLDWEIARKKARDGLRKAKLKLAGLRVADAATQ